MAGEDAFSETTDGIKAKLSVEIPEQALTTLSQLAKQTEAYRISMEAAARATGDHQGYLEQMPTIADTATKKLGEWCDQMERAIDLKGKLGGMNIPGATGQDSANPFGDQMLGRGDLAALINPMANNDPNRIVSMGAQRGMVQQGAVGGMTDEQIKTLANAIAGAVGNDEPANDGGGGKRPKVPGGHKPEENPEDDQGLSPRALEQGALKGRDLVGRLMNEAGPGSSLGDAVGAGRDLLGMAEGAGGMLGKVGSALGPVGAGVGLALTANQLLQMGGEKYQQYRNMGGEAGGGASEGMGYDAQAKMLALDPFISTAQAREVIQGALSAGHAGASFDKVTDFLATNLKDMNIQVGDSVNLLKTNVEEGGASIEQLSAQLANLTGMARDGSQSRSELVKDFGANTAALTQAGVGNQGNIAEQFMGAFQGSPMLASVGSTVLQSALNSPAFTGMLSEQTGIRKGTPQATMRAIGDSGKLPEATWNALAQMAKQAQAQGGGDKYQTYDYFYQMVQTVLGPQAMSYNEAAGLYDKLIAPGGAAAATQAGSEALQAGSKPTDRGFVDQSLESLQSLGSQAANLIGGAASIVTDIVTLDWGSIGKDIDANQARKGQIDREHEANNAGYTNDVLQNAVKQYGVKNLQVTDPNTGQAAQLDQSDKDQRDKLAAGELLISRQGGGPPQTLQQFGAGEKASATGVNVTASPIQVTYSGPISGPASVPLTAHHQQANAGEPGAQVNNPPPGDR